MSGRAQAGGFDRLLRFFCGRRGAAMARGLITAWTAFGTVAAAVIMWFASEAYAEFKGMRHDLRTVREQLAAAGAHDMGRDRQLAELEAKAARTRDLLDDHEKRLIRLEARQP